MTDDDEGKATERRGTAEYEPTLAEKLALLIDVRRQPDGRRWNGAALARSLSGQYGVTVSKEMITGVLRGDQLNPSSNTRNGLAELLGVPLEYLAEPINDRIKHVIADVHHDLLRQQREVGATDQDKPLDDTGDSPSPDEEALTSTLVLGVNQRVRLIADGVAKETGVTTSQAEALLELAGAGRSMTIGEFAVACRTPSATTTRIADALEARDLIIGGLQQGDRRVRRIEISARGQEIVDRHTRAPASAVLEAMDSVASTPAERQVLFKVLAALAGMNGAPEFSSTDEQPDKDSPGPPEERGVA